MSQPVLSPGQLFAASLAQSNLGYLSEIPWPLNNGTYRTNGTHSKKTTHGTYGIFQSAGDIKALRSQIVEEVYCCISFFDGIK